MSFSLPQWSSTNENYTINILNDETFQYKEIKQSSGEDFYSAPNTEVKAFKASLDIIANEINIQGKSWFASPIKTSLFLKKVRNVFLKIPEKNYGNTCLFTWVPYSLVIYSNYYELLWKVAIEKHDAILPSNFIEYSDEFDIPLQEISNPAEVELKEVTHIESEALPVSLSNIQLTSRANVKKKIRETRLRASILALKAEKLAEKYYRRYGSAPNFEYESDLSLNSDGEETE